MLFQRWLVLCLLVLYGSVYIPEGRKEANAYFVDLSLTIKVTSRRPGRAEYH